LGKKLRARLPDYRIAAAAGLTRRELLCSHTVSEMAELRALDARGEIGERRMDLRIAKMTMHLVACWAGKKHGPVRLRDFLLPALDDVEPAVDEDEALQRFDAQAGF